MAPITAPRSVAMLRPANGSAETVRQIAAIMRGFSLEATRLTASDLDALKGVLTPGAAIYLTAVPHRPANEQIEAAIRTRAAGFEPVPHLAARSFASIGVLENVLARLSAQAAVRRTLIIAGDRDQPAGPFANAIDVIESGLLQRHGIAEIGIAGYPEGHPRITPQALDRALAAKIEAAEQTGLAVHIVTQFAFDARAILAWIAKLRDQGIEQPVRIGVAGPTSLSTLLRYAQRCGVRASAHGLTRQTGIIKHLIGSSAPDGILRPIAELQASGRYGRIVPHFYSFGGAAATARWAAAAAAGRIVLHRGEGFGVEPP